MPPSMFDPGYLASLLSHATGLPLTGRNSPHVRPPRAESIQRFAIAPDGDAVVLTTWPAELQDQARAFYGDPSGVARVLDLASSHAWAARPNGHLSYWQAAPGRRWYFAGGSLALARYMRQWQEDLGEVHSYPRDAVAAVLWPWLLHRGYAGESDRRPMEQFLAHARPEVHLRPAVRISRRWPISEAQRLHDRGGFAGAVREAVDNALDTLGEPALG